MDLSIDDADGTSAEKIIVPDFSDHDYDFGANNDLVKDADETSVENTIVSDSYDDEYDFGPNDDLVKDAEDDQVFDENLNREIEQGHKIASEPEVAVIFDDEEKDASDSGVEDGGASNSDREVSVSRPTLVTHVPVGRGQHRKKAVDASNVDREVVKSPPTIVKCVPVVGRGRFGKKAVNENNEELPPPGILDVEPEKGFYSRNAKIATLPISYYRNRQDPTAPNERRVRRAQSPLINFQATFSQISFIVDKDDSNDRGYLHACKLLQEQLPNIEFDPSKFQYDIWSFGLYIYQIDLQKPLPCSLLNLIPQEINNEEKRPFWFMFKRPPTFQDPILRDKISKKSDTEEGTFINVGRPIYSDLSYGALTSMSHFYVHKDYIIRKKTKWALRFRDEFFEIQANVFQPSHYNATPSLGNQVKYKIPIDIIDRTAIIHLWNDGFNLFLNMKGNVHKFHRERKPRSIEKVDLGPFIRQGIRDNKPMPSFSTIRIRIQLKTDELINEGLERDGKLLTSMSTNEKDELLKTTRAESLQQIKEIFKNLLEFFYKNRVHVCFGPISSRNVSLDQLTALDFEMFPTFIQSYSWAMLCNIGFRVQVQLYYTKEFKKRLHKYSELRYEKESLSDINDRFYRLCIYLHRRSSEYFFLDFDREIQIFIAEYDLKTERSKEKNLNMPQFTQLSSSTAYIPSVVLTPTTIKIRPLKLCKLNRVLRERRFGGVLNFALIELRDEAQRLLFPTVFRALKSQILNYLTNGFPLIPSQIYKYLHHSQSQVKTKQFWFYYHDEKHKYLSHADAYAWMGNFDKERIVAKHAARIALCFTSTDATIQIPADMVTYDRDVKDSTKKYAFTDGVGTISTQLRDQIKDFLGRRNDFSVLQIRYGGCKGTLSVDPNLDNKQYQLKIRDSMNKFTTDHDILELCKLSAPRPLYLNRQDIVLLENRDIPHTHFLHLQNKYHFWLIRALLIPSVAYELLQEKLLPVFKLRNIARYINIVEEQFFIKLIITCAFNIIRELLDRTRIHISNKKARNMFGIVDEYRVLEYGQVFIQYTVMRENKLNKSKGEEQDEDEDGNDPQETSCPPEIYTGKVVITKNPCHHPGDLRVFDAVDHPKLRHLVDVVVFPQKGHRPHSNEISGSDLDGDEYVVIWDEDLIPETPNEIPYEYDSQEDPPKMDRPIERADINKVVMEVSEQDCLGSLSNIHLAYADIDGIGSEICKKLAGDISQEVDAAKTGKHPLSETQIFDLRDGLENKWPDFMKSRGKKEYYPSKRVLGKLYRSAHRAVLGWSRAISNHGNPRHVHVALALASGTDIKAQEIDENIIKINPSLTYNQPLDEYIYHEDWKKYLKEIKALYSDYRNELLEIISLYRFQDEIDLLCRCESMDASGGGKKGSLEDSAAIEVKNLIRRITQNFFAEFDQRLERKNCCRIILTQNPKRPRKRIDCDTCRESKLAKAACAYIYSYQESNRLSLKSNRRILSFPWLFSTYLIRLRYINRPQNYVDQSNTMVGRACSLYLNDFTPKFKVFIPQNSIDITSVELNYKKVEEKQTRLFLSNNKSDEKVCSVPFLRVCFAEILNDWLIKQEIFGETCEETDPKPLIPESIWHELLIHFLSKQYQPNVRLSSVLRHQNFIMERYREAINNYHPKWTNREYRELQDMFCEIHSLAEHHAKTTKLTIWTYLDEYIILALQCIGIEKRLVEKWICPTSST